MIDRLLEKLVCVRSDQSGVWIGTLLAIQPGATGADVVLGRASKIHYWEGAEATSGLGLRGPGKGSRVCDDVDLVLVAGCCEVILCAPAVAERMNEVERWRV